MTHGNEGKETLYEMYSMLIVTQFTREIDPAHAEFLEWAMKTCNTNFQLKTVTLAVSVVSFVIVCLQANIVHHIC